MLQHECPFHLAYYGSPYARFCCHKIVRFVAEMFLDEMSYSTGWRADRAFEPV